MKGRLWFMYKRAKLGQCIRKSSWLSNSLERNKFHSYISMLLSWFSLLVSLPVTRITDWVTLEAPGYPGASFWGFSGKGQPAPWCFLLVLTFRRVYSAKKGWGRVRQWQHWKSWPFLQWEQYPWHTEWLIKWWHLFRHSRAPSTTQPALKCPPLQ